MKSPPDPHYRHRFPAEVISHAVWLYHVFSLSLRDVELLLAERGVVVSYETVRRWCKKFGTGFADRHFGHRAPSIAARVADADQDRLIGFDGVGDGEANDAGRRAGLSEASPTCRPVRGRKPICERRR